MHGSMWRREETRPVGYAVRPRRLSPTLQNAARSVRLHRDVEIAHIGELNAGEGGAVESDFRKLDEGKSA